MHSLGNSPAPFGRRGISHPTHAVRTADIRRGVAAVDSLSREFRFNPAARVACLFYALRGDTGGLPVQVLIRLVDERIAAFEWMAANRPQLMALKASSEAAVHEAIATEPLIDVAGHRRFDAGRFISRVERSTLPLRRAAETFKPGAEAVA